MNKADGGGPAFPQLGRCDHETFDDLRGGMVREERLLTNGGMSLRDYFAGQFLTTVQMHGSGILAVDVAHQCYVMADAMLAERAK